MEGKKVVQIGSMTRRGKGVGTDFSDFMALTVLYDSGQVYVLEISNIWVEVGLPHENEPEDEYVPVRHTQVVL